MWHHDDCDREPTDASVLFCEAALYEHLLDEMDLEPGHYLAAPAAGDEGTVTWQVAPNQDGSRSLVVEQMMREGRDVDEIVAAVHAVGQPVPKDHKSPRR